MWQLRRQGSLWPESLGWPLQAILHWTSQKSSGLGWLLRCFLLGFNPRLRSWTAHVELRTGYFQPALRCVKGSLLQNSVRRGNNWRCCQSFMVTTRNPWKPMCVPHLGDVRTSSPDTALQPPNCTPLTPRSHWPDESEAMAEYSQPAMIELKCW